MSQRRRDRSSVVVGRWMLLAMCWGGQVFGHDFRLYSARVEEDGFTREVSYFQNADRTRVQINLPGGWSAAAEPASLTLTSAAAMGSLIRMENSRFTPDVAFKDKGLETYRRQALAALPDGASNVRMAEEHADPLPIFRWKSHEFEVEYDFFGASYRRSVLFLDIGEKEQLVVTALATKADYARVHGVAFDVLRSWQTLPAN